MAKLEADIIVVGSGAGGATAAKELAKGGRKVLIAEKGAYFPRERIGSELYDYKYKFYDRHGLWSKTREGVFYYRAIMAGGTTVVSCGNGVRALENEFKDLGIDLTEEFLETERELHIKPIPDRYIGKGTRKIMQAANKLGLDMEPMPKFINFEKCISCGNCILGCRTDAKWTALKYLKEAQDNGATLATGIDIIKVLVSNGRAIGVEGYNQRKEEVKIFANIIVLAAGAIGTPIILQNSGIKAGEKLFLHLFQVTMGITKDVGLTKEPTMAAVNHNKGFILSPFVDAALALVSVIPLRHILKITQRKRMLGIMVKIKDERLGRVHKDGVIEKIVTSNDSFKLNNGAEIAKEILLNAGAGPGTIVTTKIRGAHPGSTAAIGEVVDKNLETEIKRLFVCDASVLPTSSGVPPIVTIIALSKKFVKKLVGAKES